MEVGRLGEADENFVYLVGEDGEEDHINHRRDDSHSRGAPASSSSNHTHNLLTSPSLRAFELQWAHLSDKGLLDYRKYFAAPPPRPLRSASPQAETGSLENIAELYATYKQLHETASEREFLERQFHAQREGVRKLQLDLEVLRRQHNDAVARSLACAEVRRTQPPPRPPRRQKSSPACFFSCARQAAFDANEEGDLGVHHNTTEEDVNAAAATMAQLAQVSKAAEMKSLIPERKLRDTEARLRKCLEAEAGKAAVAARIAAACLKPGDEEPRAVAMTRRRLELLHSRQASVHAAKSSQGKAYHHLSLALQMLRVALSNLHEAVAAWHEDDSSTSNEYGSLATMQLRHRLHASRLYWGKAKQEVAAARTLTAALPPHLHRPIAPTLDTALALPSQDIPPKAAVEATARDVETAYNEVVDAHAWQGQLMRDIMHDWSQGTKLVDKSAKHFIKVCARLVRDLNDSDDENGIFDDLDNDSVSSNNNHKSGLPAEDVSRAPLAQENPNTVKLTLPPRPPPLQRADSGVATTIARALKFSPREVLEE
eukprot:jgi/Chlat1/8874/Chrsp92S08194